MNKKKRNIKSMLLTLFLLFSLVVVFYTTIGVFISGPAIKYEKKQESITQKISKKEKDIKTIEKHSFKYVTYIAQTKKEYVVYDKNAKEIAIRAKKDARFEEAKEVAIKKNNTFQDVDATIGYGYEEVVYVFEKGHIVLLLDYDTLEEVFYMKEG